MIAAAAIAWVGMTASVAAWALLGSRPRSLCLAATPPPSAPVLLLRPCAGDEPWLERALTSSAHVARGSEVRLLVESASDRACRPARRARSELKRRGIEARLVVTHARGPNRKADQLARCMAIESGGQPIVVVADSDVVLDRHSIARLVAPILAGACDATWAPPIEIDSRTPADHASHALLGASLHSFALLAALDRRGMVGKLFAVRRSALDAVGGFAPLTDFLGEDIELARRLRLAGLRLAVAPVAALSAARGRSWGSTVARYARWIAVIRAQRPALLPSYPLLLAAAPLQMALACTAAFVEGQPGLLAVAAVLAYRALLAAGARRRSGLSATGSWVAPWMADLSLLAAFLRAMQSSSVGWRGVTLRLDRGRISTEAAR